MRARALPLLWLVVVWMALWGTISVANLLSGLAVGSLLLVLFPTRQVSEATGRFRPLRALELLAYFLWKLLEANTVVAWEVITPSNESVKEAVVAVPMTGASDTVVAIVANAVSLTPGTLTIEVERDPTVLYVHVLHLRTIEQVRADVLKMERAVLRAFGTDDAIASAERRLAETEAAMRSTGEGGR